MQYAEIDGVRRTAEPKLKAVCSHCGSEVKAKCGSKVVWHWAHVALENCDSWYEPETLWHRNWKSHFGAECSEISIVKEDTRHIADVLTRNGLVIEFQNSPIASETIVARETFYEKMIWVINGDPFKDNIQLLDKDYYQDWKLKPEVINEFYHPALQRLVKAMVVRGSGIKYDAIREVLLKNKFTYYPQADLYVYDLTLQPNTFTLEAKLDGGILARYKEGRTEPKFKPVLFEWNPPRKSWMDAKAPVFIDFNNEYLLLIKSGIGQKNGEGLKVSKKDFLAKYIAS